MISPFDHHVDLQQSAKEHMSLEAEIHQGSVCEQSVS